MKKFDVKSFIKGMAIGLLLTLLIGIYWFFLYLRSFSYQTNKPLLYYTNTIIASWRRKSAYENKVTNFLILGLDQRDDRLENTLLTDTIILASYNNNHNALSFIPIPRDLWINELKTKINAVYYYGEKESDRNGPEFTKNLISDITEQDIDHTIVLDYNLLSEAIDHLDGIYVDVAESFTDALFPNPRYLGDEGELESEFITITFDKGIQFMNGTEAVNYIRSRKAVNGGQGTDTARGVRQTAVMQGIFNRLLSSSFLTDFMKTSGIYNFWSNEVTKDVNDEQLLGLLFSAFPQVPKFKQISIPTALFDDGKSILYHPYAFQNRQWVFVPRDPTWDELQDYLNSKLN